MNAEKETLRIEAFSDGAFSIANTLLALELPFPKIEHIKNNKVLTEAFFNSWPSHLAFVLSFFSALIMWINHPAIFRHIHKANSHIMFASGFALLLAVAVPYPTSFIAEYFDTPATNSAVAVYGGLFILINISYNWLWYAASKNQRFLKPEASDRTIKPFRKIYLLGFPVCVIAFIVAFYSAVLSITICMALWIYRAVTIKKYNE